MRLFLDIDTRSFLVSPSFPRVLAAISVKRRDSDLLELQFIRDRTAQELPAGATVRVGLKALNDFSGGYLSAATFTQSGTGADTVYLTDLNLNTTEVNAAFTAATPEPESIAAMLEVEWSAGTNVSSSLTLPVTLYNDVIRGDEATPASSAYLRRVNLPAPRVRLNGGVQPINIWDANGDPAGTYNLVNAPIVTAVDLPQSLLDEIPIYLELVILKRLRRSGTGWFAPPPYTLDGSGNVTWTHPWPQTHLTRAGVHKLTLPDGTRKLLGISRPNHLPVTSQRQRLNAWHTLHGRHCLRSVKYTDSTGTVTNSTLVMPCGGRSNQPRRRAWSSLVSPLRVAWRFVAWDAATAQIISGPMSPILTIAPSKAPFLPTAPVSGTLTAQLNPLWTGDHRCYLAPEGVSSA